MNIRNIIISTFVIMWILLFHYESTRHFYLESLFHHNLPKVKFLFPPAGWIMFFNVDDSFGQVQVYGVKENRPQFIDPHLILQTRAIGYDNIHRNVLVSMISPGMAKPFCTFLERKFPYFDNFMILYVNYPLLTNEPFKQEQSVAYECR